MALKAAAELMDSADKSQSVLRIVIDNMIFPITLEVIHRVLCYSDDIVCCISSIIGV